MKSNRFEEGKVELGRGDKLNSPPPSPSLSALLPPCLNHHHLYNLSQINYILSHLIPIFLVFKESNSNCHFFISVKNSKPSKFENKEICIQTQTATYVCQTYSNKLSSIQSKVLNGVFEFFVVEIFWYVMVGQSN